MTPLSPLEPRQPDGHKTDTPPDWDNIRHKLKAAPDEIGGLKKEVIFATLDLIQAQWDEIQKLPRTLDNKAIHIRPENLKGLTKVVQIFGDQIFIVNKGKGTEKIGDGYFKEPTRGVHLNAMQSFVHATVRLDGQEFVKAEIRALTERALGNVPEYALLSKAEIEAIFQGEIDNLPDHELFLKKDVAAPIQKEIGKIGNYETLLKHEIRAVIEQMLNLFLSKEYIRTLIEQEIRLLELSKGEDSIVQLYQSCTYSSKKKIGRPSVEKIAFSMEDCQAGDLLLAMNKTVFAEILNDNKDAVMSFVRILIESLVVLEKHGILHRDIKPENIFVKLETLLLKSFLKGKLGDFGLGNFRSKEIERLQKEGEGVGGSAEYSSPLHVKTACIIGEANEAFRKDHLALIMSLCSHAIDVWSMGIVLYEFLFGDLPPFIRNANATQEEIDGHLKYAFNLEQNLAAIEIKNNPEEEQADVFCFPCLNKDPAAKQILFKLLSGMLQIEQDKCLSGSQLLLML